MAFIGALTALFAATIGFFQYDIKKVLAYSTVSQLGFMFIGVGVGAYWAGVFHLMTHAFFKACLFLGSGSRHPRLPPRAGHAQHGRPEQADAVTALTYLSRASPSPASPCCGLLLQGRDPLEGLHRA